MKATVTVRYPLSTDVGLLLIRLAVGAVGFFHGAQKLFGVFGGKGVSAFAENLASMNIPQPLVSAYLAGAAEFLGGLLVAVGLLTRLAALPFAFTMFVAVTMVHNKAYSLEHNGMEYALTLLLVLVGLALTGPGRLSLDAMYWSGRARRKKDEA